MFAKKKTKIILTLTDEKIKVGGSLLATMGEVEESIKSLASMIEQQTGIKANLVLTKLAFDMIK